jgi:cation transporter-like permease
MYFKIALTSFILLIVFSVLGSVVLTLLPRGDDLKWWANSILGCMVLSALVLLVSVLTIIWI